MKIRLITALAIALLLVATMSLPAIAADEQTLGASVTVNSIISITITDSGAAGINFGSLNAGTTNALDVGANSTTPSVIVTLNTGSNVNVDMQIKGTDFGAGFPVSNAKYSTTNISTKIPLSTSYATTNATFASNVAPGGTASLWHWLDVPSGVTAGIYNSTFSYKAIAH